MEFIKYIIEARALRSVSALGKMDVEDVADSVYLHILALQTMKGDPKQASEAMKYAKNTIKNFRFDSIRSSSTDLHNWLAVLMNPDKFSDKIGELGKTNVPELQLRTYLRNVASGKVDKNFDNRFLLNLERSLGISNSQYKSVRRLAGNWDKLRDSDKKLATTRLAQALRRKIPNSDMKQSFEKFSKVSKTPRIPTGIKYVAGIAAAAYIGSKIGHALTGGAGDVDKYRNNSRSDK